ncbi:nickel-responsive transcriptional regulator NikR [Aminithiophilus ramosus]|uniref:Nickel-responsive transcriptional regulator NikR n=2 Tax=Synergistales TaxID=649776 RepID=A0ACD1DZ37_9BACT|nr:nickel-responsive transcriptional regulator NikR [Aminithiophilus ramosus]QTX33583.1 nickel-responsive transcriptional regulator NikR [Aminithiophilus ramosus]QVL37437.1 nickel-responsive transcriptional regulator NikR [Synergistota bacterium]
MTTEDRIRRFSVSIPEGLLGEFDQWICEQGLPSRSEALRRLIRDGIARSNWEEEKGTLWGTVTVYFDHRGDGATHLNQLQHDHGHSIICTTHVHVDADHCLEVLVLNGSVQDIKAFLFDLSKIKGIESSMPVVSASETLG